MFLVFRFKHVLREADRRVVMKPLFRINIKAVRHSCAFTSKDNSLRQVCPSFRSQIFSLMPQIRHWKEWKLVTNSRYRPDIWTMCATFTFMMDFLMVNQWSMVQWHNWTYVTLKCTFCELNFFPSYWEVKKEHNSVLLCF